MCAREALDELAPGYRLSRTVLLSLHGSVSDRIGTRREFPDAVGPGDQASVRDLVTRTAPVSSAAPRSASAMEEKPASKKICCPECEATNS
jgi:hypothetical protein